LVLPLPLDMVERLGLKDGDVINLSDETIASLFGKQFPSRQADVER
jgi:hypothetical protein